MEVQNDEQLYNSVKAEVENIIKFNELKEAYRLYNKIQELIDNNNYREKNPELYHGLNKLMTRLQWVALPFFSLKKVLWLFNNHFQTVLEMEDFYLWDKFKHVLLGIIMHEDRDKFKQKIKKILEKNQARITPQKLENNLPPTAENWIKSYTSNLGTGLVDSVKLLQYLLDNKDIKNLAEKEKDKLIKFFEFYERLKFSSLTTAGVEESIPINTPEFKGYISDGRLIKESRLDPQNQKIFNIVSGKSEEERVNKLKEEKEHYAKEGLESRALEEEISKEDKIKELRAIADDYQEGSLEKRAIEEEIKKLEVRSKK